MVTDEEDPKQDVALLEAHGMTCLLTGSVQGGSFRQDTRDETPLWTRHNSRDGEGLEDKAQYNEWQIGYLGKESDRSGTEGGTRMQEYSGSPTGTSTAAGQTLSHLSSTKEEISMEPTSVRLLRGMSKTTSTAIQSSDNPTSVSQRGSADSNEAGTSAQNNPTVLFKLVNNERIK